MYELLWGLIGILIVMLIYLWSLIMYQIIYEAFTEHEPVYHAKLIRPRDRPAFVKTKREILV